MSEVERDGDQFIVDAKLLAKAFGLSDAETRARLQGGQIASVCEAGEGADAALWRLTFRHQGRALRMIVDAEGKILSNGTAPIGHPNAARRATTKGNPG